MAAGVRMIVELPDPVGEELESRTLYNGLELRKVRVPLGVVAIVYEARPNVTVDAAALAIKSGNAVVLRGLFDSRALERGAGAGSSPRPARAPACRRDRCRWSAGGDRAELAELARQDRYVDLIIPRGGEGLKEVVEGRARPCR